MSLPKLDNLVSIGQLKAEPRNEAEVHRMLAMARTHLKDARLAGAPRVGRFLSAYSAGHAAALAVLRWYGYRSENRYTVFLCLEHTIGWPADRWRVLDTAHKKRNLAEYEGTLDAEESAIAELCKLVADLITDAAKVIDPPKK